MIKIRLQRFGSNKKPFYRVVAADVSAPRDGKFIEMIGTYDPLQTPAVVKIDKEKSCQVDFKWCKTNRNSQKFI